MCVYNTEKYLEEAIQSILDQSYINFEFLIFDDGSTDKSADIIKKFKNTDSRIRAFFSETNHGYVEHLNRGLDMANGVYIARMDSDDISLPNRFEEQLKYLKANPDVQVVGSLATIIDQEGKELNKELRHIHPETLWWQSFFTNPLSHPTVMIRKSIFVESGYYDPEKIPSEDYDLWTRILAKGKIANIPYFLLKYRSHDASISHMNKNVQWQNSIQTLIRHWKTSIDTTVSPELAAFFKGFHLGYELKETEQARIGFYLIYGLYCKYNKMFWLSKDVKQDAFKKMLYLALISRKHSFWIFLELITGTLYRFPIQMLSKMLHYAS